jgi:hypothetical protein
MRLGRLLTAFLFFCLFFSVPGAARQRQLARRTPSGWLAFWVGGTWAAGSMHSRRKGNHGAHTGHRDGQTMVNDLGNTVWDESDMVRLTEAAA